MTPPTDPPKPVVVYWGRHRFELVRVPVADRASGYHKRWAVKWEVRDADTERLIDSGLERVRGALPVAVVLKQLYARFPFDSAPAEPERFSEWHAKFSHDGDGA